MWQQDLRILAPFLHSQYQQVMFSSNSVVESVTGGAIASGVRICQLPKHIKIENDCKILAKYIKKTVKIPQNISIKVFWGILKFNFYFF